MVFKWVNQAVSRFSSTILASSRSCVFYFFYDCENVLTCKIVIRQKKMFFNGTKFIIIAVLNARAVVIEADIKLPFRLSNVLCLPYFTFEEVYYEFTFTISFMVDFVCFTHGYAFELDSDFT